MDVDPLMPYGPIQLFPQVPPTADGPEFPGVRVDPDRWRTLLNRAKQASQVYRPVDFAPARQIPLSAQAPPAKPRTVQPTLFCQCGSEADLVPGGIIQCRRPSCRKQWVQK